MDLKRWRRGLLSASISKMIMTVVVSCVPLVVLDCWTQLRHSSAYSHRALLCCANLQKWSIFTLSMASPMRLSIYSLQYKYEGGGVPQKPTSIVIFSCIPPPPTYLILQSSCNNQFLCRRWIQTKMSLLRHRLVMGLCKPDFVLRVGFCPRPQSLW